VQFETTKKTESGPAQTKPLANRGVASLAPNGSAARAKTALAPPSSAIDAEELQALFVALEAVEPQAYTSIAEVTRDATRDATGAGFGIGDVRRSFGKSALAPRTIRVGGRRTSVRLEPEFWLAIAYVVSVAKIDHGKFFLDIERRCGRFAFASKIRSAVVSALLTMALVGRVRFARLAAGRSGETEQGECAPKTRAAAGAARKRMRRKRDRA
jgi:predicted DNA-binding ribbon-helix-helix protein